MQKVLSNAAMRAADSATIQGGVPSGELMLRAGSALSEEVASAAKKLNVKKITIVCGTGNNGGDGYVAARILSDKNFPVSVFAFNGKFSEDCLRERSAYTGPVTDTISGEIIVDCIFGTGLSRAVEGEYARVIEGINSSPSYVISADIPSGLNGDNGLIMGCAVKADLTVVMAHPKCGLYLNDGPDLCGRIAVKDIGISAGEATAYIADNEYISGLFPPRRRNSHKGTYGSCALVAGSEQYLGAAALCIASALRSGCGYVYASVPQSFKYALAAKYPQCIYGDFPTLKANAIAIGMGLGCSEETYQQVVKLLKEYSGKLIIDADGINSLAKYGLEPLKEAKCSVLLTPHIGEMSRLTGLTSAEVSANPIGIAKSFAKEYGVTVHLKSAACVTADAEKAVITSVGTSALAKAGSGDLLSGLIAGTAARGVDLFQSAVCAQYILGTSAQTLSKNLSEYSVTSADIEKQIPYTVNALINK